MKHTTNNYSLMNEYHVFLKVFFFISVTFDFEILILDKHFFSFKI